MTFETDEQIARPVIGPVVESVRALGVEVDETIILGAGANVVVHLAPSPIVARIATLTAEMRRRPGDYLRREREISSALVGRGVNVIGATDLVDPGPHEVDGTAFLLLRHHDLTPMNTGSQVDALRVGRAFAELSEALQDLPLRLATGAEGQPWEEIAVLVDTVSPTSTAATTDRISDVVDLLRQGEPEDPWQLVHGDAHRVNVAADDKGQITWFDFEDANRRPLAWDLATLLRSWPNAGREACRLLSTNPDSYSMRWHYELREVYALLWNLLYAQRFARTRAATARREATWLRRQVEDHLDRRVDR